MLQTLIHLSLWLLNQLISLVHLPMYLYYRLQKPKRCPPIFNDVFFLPATIIAERIREQTLSSVNVVSLYIQRAKEVNEVCNAIVQDRFELAMREAQHADEFVISSGLSVFELAAQYPLLGVPLSVKECIAVEGMSFSAGSLIDSKTAERDAEVIGMLKNAGAIIFCLTNTAELCMNWETFNYKTGRSLNPYDTRRTCGGSSGGEVVLLATCGSLIGIGTDLVGSGRGPPSFCGVYGHRTSGLLVSTDTHIPQLHIKEMSICPLTRYAIDLPLVLKCMLPKEKLVKIKLEEAFDPRNIRVWYKFDSGNNFPTSGVNYQIVNAMKSVVEHLQNDGFQIEQAELNCFKDQFDIAFLNLLSIENSRETLSYKDVSIFTELIKFLVCSPRVVLSVILYKILYWFYKLFYNEGRIEKHRKLAIEMKTEIEQLLGDNGVLLYPTFPHTAGIHGSIYSKTVDTCYMGIFNVLNLPVTVIPIGMDSQGLPIGIQVVAKEFNDRVPMIFARYMEITFGGWVSPTYNVLF